MCNRIVFACKTFFEKPLFRDQRTLFALWLLIPVIATFTRPSRCNNFLIFKHVFWHAWNGLSLYSPYPAEYNDINHYGPFFSIVIAPFAVLPQLMGLLLWNVALAMFLYVAIRKSQFTKYQQIFILWFCAHELLTALFMQQFNVAIAAVILFSYYFIEKEKDFWAAFMIMLGTFVKLYGNDVASNLKWVMSSNSIAVTPKHTVETWFMEGTLIPNYHYIEVKDDFSDLEEHLTYYIKHPEEAEAIIRHAHEYVDQFRDLKREKLISLLVLKRYFSITNGRINNLVR